MFFIALTKQKISSHFQNCKIEEFTFCYLHCTLISDEHNIYYDTHKDGFTLTESLHNSTHNNPQRFVSIVGDMTSATISISKSTIAGRSLYYHLTKDGEFYCSTHISLLRWIGIPIEENSTVLPEFFIYRYIMPPYSLYKDIYHVFTGGLLALKIANKTCTITSHTHYTPPQSKQKHSISVKDLYQNIVDAITSLWKYKRNVTTILSGGIDSSITSKIGLDVLDITDSYSTGYPFENDDENIEKEYALSAAEELGFNHNYYEPTTEEYLKGFLESIASAEEPLHHLQTILLHLLYKNAIPPSKNIILHGQGAGFAFGNVTDYLSNYEKISSKLLSAKPIHAILSKTGQKTKTLVEKKREATTKLPFSHPDNPLWHWHDFGDQKWVCRYFNTTEEKIIKSRVEFITKNNKHSIYDKWSLYSLIGDEDTTLPLWTKLGETQNKTLYAPFYDTTLLDNVFSIPWKLKLQSPNHLRKKIAQHAQLPSFIITRPKSSFGIKAKQWVAPGGIFEPIIPLAITIIEEKHLRSMQSAEPKKSMMLWNMLNYSIWKRLCIHNEPIDILLEELNDKL